MLISSGLRLHLSSLTLLIPQAILMGPRLNNYHSHVENAQSAGK
jgi:hypothetical protein